MWLPSNDQVHRACATALDEANEFRRPPVNRYSAASSPEAGLGTPTVIDRTIYITAVSGNRRGKIVNPAAYAFGSSEVVFSSGD